MSLTISWWMAATPYSYGFHLSPLLYLAVYHSIHFILPEAFTITIIATDWQALEIVQI